MRRRLLSMAVILGFLGAASITMGQPALATNYVKAGTESKWVVVSGKDSTTKSWTYDPLIGYSLIATVPGVHAGPYYIAGQEVQERGTSDVGTEQTRGFPNCRDYYTWCAAIKLVIQDINPDEPYSAHFQLTWPGPELSAGGTKVKKTDDLNLYIFEQITHVYVYETDSDHSDDNTPGGDPTKNYAEEENQGWGVIRAAATAFYPENLNLSDVPASGKLRECSHDPDTGCSQFIPLDGPDVGAEANGPGSGSTGTRCPEQIMNDTTLQPTLCPKILARYEYSSYALLVVNRRDRVCHPAADDMTICGINKGFSISSNYDGFKFDDSEYNSGSGGKKFCFTCPLTDANSPKYIGDLGGAQPTVELTPVKVPGKDGPLTTMHLLAVKGESIGPKKSGGDKGLVLGTLMILILGAALFAVFMFITRRRKRQETPAY